MDVQAAERLARETMILHGLGKWSFRWSHAERMFGSCNHTRREIALSKPLTQINSWEKVYDTILHEIAHALAGYHAGHGPRWRAQALALGCTATRCHDELTPTVQPQARYAGSCSCGEIHERRTLGAKFLASRPQCRRCGQIIRWRDRKYPKNVIS